MYSWVHHYAIEIEELVKGISNTADQDAPWTLPDQLEESALHTRLASTKTNLERKASLAASTGTTLSQPSSDQALFTSFYAGTPATSSFGTEAHLSVEKESAVPPMPPLEKTPSRSSSKKRFGFAGTASSELPPLPPNTGTQQSQKMEAMLDLSDTFLDCAVQLVAVQITRHAWSIFASMQPRDLLRYVMTPRDPKNPDLRPQRNADNPVTEAVAFSNYLSNW